MQEKNIREKSQKENESRKKEYSASMKDTVLYAWKATIPIMAGYIVLENVIPFKTMGIDFAMTALFLTILIDQWESVKEHKPALTGILISLVFLIIFGSESFLIPAMIGITVALFLEKKWIGREEAKEE